MAHQSKKKKRIQLSLNVDSDISQCYQRIQHHGRSQEEDRVTKLAAPKSGSTKFSVTTKPYEKRIERHPENGRATVEIQHKRDDNEPFIFKKKKKSIEEAYDISDL